MALGISKGILACFEGDLRTHNTDARVPGDGDDDGDSASVPEALRSHRFIASAPSALACPAVKNRHQHNIYTREEMSA
eukprot:1240084-Pyramimonas_sp.AAC.1